MIYPNRWVFGFKYVRSCYGNNRAIVNRGEQVTADFQVLTA